MTKAEVVVRSAHVNDVPGIYDLIRPLVESNVLLRKQYVQLYESIQEFVVATEGDRLVGCGALHPMWSDLGEVRTIAVATDARGRGIGRAILGELERRARTLGLSRLFCLTFEVGFFGSHGFVEVPEPVVDPDVFEAMALSRDEGVAEFLDLAQVKQNTLGNTRMLKVL